MIQFIKKISLFVAFLINKSINVKYARIEEIIDDELTRLKNKNLSILKKIKSKKEYILNNLLSIGVIASGQTDDINKIGDKITFYKVIDLKRNYDRFLINLSPNIKKYTSIIDNTLGDISRYQCSLKILMSEDGISYKDIVSKDIRIYSNSNEAKVENVKKYETEWHSGWFSGIVNMYIGAVGMIITSVLGFWGIGTLGVIVVDSIFGTNISSSSPFIKLCKDIERALFYIGYNKDSPNFIENDIEMKKSMIKSQDGVKKVNPRCSDMNIYGRHIAPKSGGKTFYINPNIDLLIKNNSEKKYRYLKIVIDAEQELGSIFDGYSYIIKTCSKYIEL